MHRQARYLVTKMSLPDGLMKYWEVLTKLLDKTIKLKATIMRLEEN